MKLAHLVDGFQDLGGGVATYLDLLPEGLAARGVESVFLSGHKPPATYRGARCVHVPGLERDGARLTPEARTRLDAALTEAGADACYVHVICPDATRVAARHAPTIVYAHEYLTVCPGGARHLEARRRFCHEGPGARCVVRAHTQGCNNRRPDRQIAALGRVHAWRSTWADVARVLVASPFVAEVLAGDGAPAERLRVAPYPIVPLPAAKPEHCDVLFVGRLVPGKGVDVLLRALAGLDASAVVAGDGPARSELETLADTLGLRERIRFSGWVDATRVAGLLRGARLLALPSVWQEPFGIVGIEALAAGVPVVASSVGGIPSWLADGEGGVLVPPDDVDALAGTLGRLLADEAARLELAEEGPRVAARFDVGAHMNLLLEELDQLVAAPKSSAARSKHAASS